MGSGPRQKIQPEAPATPMVDSLLPAAEQTLLGLLGLASFISLAIFIERFRFLRSCQFDGQAEAERLTLEARAATLEAYAASLPGRIGPAGRVAAAAIRNLTLGKEAVREVIESERSFFRSILDSRVSVLGTIGSNAPFVGLLGTVLGIIKAFRDLASAIQSGGAQSGAVMAGISGALISTAVGLLVAIPAVMFNNICRRQIARAEQQLDGLTHAAVALAPDSAKGS